MTDFIEGENRYQSTLFPERLDDYVAEECVQQRLVCSVGDSPAGVKVRAP